MTAREAYNSKIHLECTCSDISICEWEKLMANAKKANGRKIRQMIKNQLPDLYEELALMFPNMYEQNSQRTSTHLIYVHSAIEYFLKLS